jgi:hypothetical protein
MGRRISGASAPPSSVDYVAAIHSMTSSAMASRLGGMVRPSTLAVLRSITSSRRVGTPLAIPRGRPVQNPLHVGSGASAAPGKIDAVGCAAVRSNRLAEAVKGRNAKDDDATAERSFLRRQIGAATCAA